MFRVGKFQAVEPAPAGYAATWISWILHSARESGPFPSRNTASAVCGNPAAFGFSAGLVNFLMNDAEAGNIQVSN